MHLHHQTVHLANQRLFGCHISRHHVMLYFFEPVPRGRVGRRAVEGPEATAAGADGGADAGTGAVACERVAARA